MSGPASCLPAGAVERREHRDMEEDGSSATGSGSSVQALTPELIMLRCAKGSVKGKNESRDHYLARLTHLQLQSGRLGELGSVLSHCPNTRVLYAYENRISRISGLENLRHLQHLYLQNNQITALTPGLSGLVNLQKLYLSHNQVRRIEGIEASSALEELHVAHQRIPDPLQFDQAALGALRSLRVLDVAGNKLQDLRSLVPLQSLEFLDASENDLEDVSVCADVLLSARPLRKVNLGGNPLTRGAGSRYRDAVIDLCDNVVEIDEKEVRPQEREFVRQLQKNRKAKMRQSSLQSQSQAPLA